MRGALHVLATIVLVPYIVLAFGFLVLGQAIATGSLLGFFETLLAHVAWLVPWGIIGFACGVCALAILGAMPRYRGLGALCLGAIAAICLVVIVVVSSAHIGGPELLFLLPCAAVLALGASTAVSEHRARQAVAP